MPLHCASALDYTTSSNPPRAVFPHRQPPPRVQRFIHFALRRLPELAPRLL